MVMIAAASQATGLVSVQQLENALEALTPPYRRNSIKKNIDVMQAGAAYAEENLMSLGVQAWAPVQA